MADRLWITYAWVDNEEGDFSFLVQELREAGVEATYDKVGLVPGQRLWEQIGDKIIDSPLSGWAYLLTRNSITREACKEELAYALYRALTEKGKSFPLIGLLNNVEVADVPPALKVRLCVNLADPTWREQVKAGVDRRAPDLPARRASKYVWNVHHGYQGNPAHIAVEVRPRFGSVIYWRFAVPASAVIAKWGVGPAGGGGISITQTVAVDGGSMTVEGTSCTFFGSADAVSPAISAYVVFDGRLPQFVVFGQAKEPHGPPVPPRELFEPA